MNFRTYLSKENVRYTNGKKFEIEAVRIAGENWLNEHEQKAMTAQEGSEEALIAFYSDLIKNEVTSIYHGLFYHRHIAVMQRLLKNLNGARNLLEIGSFDGLLTTYLAMKHPEMSITAVDINPLSLELAEKRAKKYGLTNLKYIQADSLNLGMGKEFDFVHTAYSIHERKEYAIIQRGFPDPEPQFMNQIKSIYDVLDGRVSIFLSPCDEESLIYEIESYLEYLDFKLEKTERVKYNFSDSETTDLMFIASNN